MIFEYIIYLGDFVSQYFDNDKSIKSEKRKIKFYFKNREYNLISDNGVFSKDRFDYGTRVLLENIDIDNLSGSVLDLGCGIGVVGIILGTINKNINIDMVDINDRAIEITKDNLLLTVSFSMFAKLLMQCHIHHHQHQMQYKTDFFVL